MFRSRCSNPCQTEAGFTCAGTPSACAPTCGDGVVAGAETCDDGNTVAGDCCSPTCTVEPGCEVEPNGSIASANGYTALDFNQSGPLDQIQKSHILDFMQAR